MKYSRVVKGIFESRPNRFIAYVNVEGETQVVHVKNTGRCQELLVPRCTVYLECAQNSQRKTPYDLIAVVKERQGKPPLLVNMDSQVVNGVVEEWLREGNLFEDATLIRREVSWGKSRFDFYIEASGRKIFLEVKGVTLETDGVASFPDAHTERGVKHLGELVACQEDGYAEGHHHRVEKAPKSHCLGGDRQRRDGRLLRRRVTDQKGVPYEPQYEKVAVRHDRLGQKDRPPHPVLSLGVPPGHHRP